MTEADRAQIAEILTYTENPSSRGEALKILLGLTGSPEGRRNFRDTDTCKKMFRVIVEEAETSQ
jgi:hypothetical protein